jgi:hypothetical protein
MKRYIQIALCVLVAQCGLLNASDYYGNPSDYSVVSDIKKKSNLTENDVEKWKISGLGSLQNIVALSAVSGAGYATYKAGEGSYQLAGQAFEYIGVTEGSAGVFSNKMLWALAGAAGIGMSMYKILYPRIESGILKQVKAYVALCENLDVVKYLYTWEGLSGMGQSAGNSAWATNNYVARSKGIHNLLDQAEYALKLLDQLNDSSEVENLRKRVAQIKVNLSNNVGIIDHAANNELHKRKQAIAEGMQGAQQAAHLRLTEEQASALKVGKISLAATAISNFFSKGLQTLVYINDNKEKIFGGAVIVGLSAYGAYAYIKNKLGFGPITISLTKE